MSLIEAYCPICGTFQDSFSVDVKPGTYKWTCPHCDTGWLIKIEFTKDDK